MQPDDFSTGTWEQEEMSSDKMRQPGGKAREFVLSRTGTEFRNLKLRVDSKKWQDQKLPTLKCVSVHQPAFCMNFVFAPVKNLSPIQYYVARRRPQKETCGHPFFTDEGASRLPEKNKGKDSPLNYFLPCPPELRMFHYPDQGAL
jgi:hypothetical protein